MLLLQVDDEYIINPSLIMGPVHRAYQITYFLENRAKRARIKTTKVFTGIMYLDANDRLHLMAMKNHNKYTLPY